MGVDIVSSDPNVFASDTGILNQNPPLRASTRDYIDTHVMTPEVMTMDFAAVQRASAQILEDWRRREDMASMVVIRSTATRIFLRLLSGVTISVPESDRVTWEYLRAFTESSLFHGYAPWMLGLLGTHERVRRETYFPLERRGIDLMAIDVTMFAAMPSIGTLVLRCVEDTKRFGIRYADLSHEQKRAFVYESVRLFPTVTSVHRRLTEPESVEVCGKRIRLEPGDEIAYPFVCSNRDPAVFSDPDAMDIGRSDEARDEVLSWSKGPYSCPAKEHSIHVVIAMLDTLSERHELSGSASSTPSSDGIRRQALEEPAHDHGTGDGRGRRRAGAAGGARAAGAGAASRRAPDGALPAAVRGRCRPRPPGAPAGGPARHLDRVRRDRRERPGRLGRSRRRRARRRSRPLRGRTFPDRRRRPVRPGASGAAEHVPHRDRRVHGGADPRGAGARDRAARVRRRALRLARAGGDRRGDPAPRAGARHGPRPAFPSNRGRRNRSSRTCSSRPTSCAPWLPCCPCRWPSRWRTPLCSRGGRRTFGLSLAVSSAAVFGFAAGTVRFLELTEPDVVVRQDDAKVKALEEAEDLTPQNQFTMVAPVRDSAARRLLLRGTLFLSDEFSKHFSTSGRLVGVETIHFARIHQIDQGRRFLFMSDFDGGWNRYLFDFLTTGAFAVVPNWTNLLGCPKTQAPARARRRGSPSASSRSPGPSSSAPTSGTARSPTSRCSTSSRTRRSARACSRPTATTPSAG